MADVIYNTFREYIGDGTIDLDNHTFKAMLLTSAYTPSASHTLIASVNANELSSGSGYTTGGTALTSVTWTRSGATVTLDAADTQWTSATFTAAYGVIYDDSVASDAVCFCFDFGGNKTVTNGTFTMQYNASGIATLS